MGIYEAVAAGLSPRVATQLTSDLIPTDVFTGTFKVTGGTMHCRGPGCFEAPVPHANFVVEGGTLKFERHWVSTGSIVV